MASIGHWLSRAGWVALAAGLISVGGVACDSTSTESTGSSAPEVQDPPRLAAATLQQLLGPWRPTPFVLDPAFRGAVEAFCRREMEGAPGTRLVVADARGEGVVSAELLGPGGQGVGCDGLEIRPDGRLLGAAGGWGGNGNAAAAADRTISVSGSLSVAGGSLKVGGWGVSGQAGAGIANVVVEVPGRPPILASFENGRFRAWWPRLPGEPDPMMGGPKVEIRIVGYDLGGGVVNSTTRNLGG